MKKRDNTEPVEPDINVELNNEDSSEVDVLIPIRSLPFRYRLPNGNIVNIFKEEDLAFYGFRLYTEEELLAQQQIVTDTLIAQQLVEEEKLQEIIFLRQAYRDTTNAMCQLAEVPIVDKVESAFELADMKNQIIDIEKRLAFAELALQLQTLIIELRRKDGDDAWERI